MSEDKQDREIVCVGCRKPFIWTASEQVFFDSKGFTETPKRCRPCRAERKERIARLRGEDAASIARRDRYQAERAQVKP